MAEPVADLTGAIVVVAGAGGGGIGTCSCEAALTAGAEVVAVERSPEELDKLDTLPRPVVKVHTDPIAPVAPAAAVFLLSPQASCIAGQVLAVDGGMSVKLTMLGDDNAPVFVADPEVRARMMGSDPP